MKISDYVESQIKGLWGTDFDENGIPVIKTNNLTYEGNIDYSDICKRNITKEQAKECYLKPGDLLIEKSGGTKTHSVGYVSYFEGDENKFVCNNFILALRLKNTINSKFLFYQIQFKYESNQFSDCFNKTTGIQNLKVKDYLAKEIKIYSPEEQEKIVKELDTVRLIINKNKQILEKYDILIKSRFIEMFGDNKYPKISISEMVEDKVPSAKKLFNKTDEIKYIDISSVDNKINEIVGYTEYIFEEAPSRAQQHIRKNDILISTVRPNLKNIAINRVDYKETVASSGFCVLRPKCVPEYLFVAVLQDEFTRDMVAVTTGANYPAIKDSDVLNYEISNPPLELQQQFAAFVQQIDKSKFEIWRYINFNVIIKYIGLDLYVKL